MIRPMGDDELYLTTEQMRTADARCIEQLGIPSAVLMENAGRAVFEALDLGPVGVVCGKGNNAGDGYVAARHALLAGMETRVVSVKPIEELEGDAKRNMEIFRRLGGSIEVVSETRAAIDAVQDLDDCSAVVDALLGTGISGEVRGLYRDVILNWPQARTVAVDLPSGLDGDTGEALGCAVRADVTVTIAYPFEGFKNPEAKHYTGRVLVADIGIPDCCAVDEHWAVVAARL